MQKLAKRRNAVRNAGISLGLFALNGILGHFYGHMIHGVVDNASVAALGWNLNKAWRLF